MDNNDPCSKCGKPGEFRPGSRQCRECEKSYHKAHNVKRSAQRAAYRLSNRERDRPKAANRYKRGRIDQLKEIKRIKSVACADCGKSFPYYVMDFDHLDPNRKVDKVSRLASKPGYPWSKIFGEISKCEVVCANCHRRRTHKTDSSDPRSILVASLKSTPCADCGGVFHYSQMDFDHVRGKKIGCVSKMSSKRAILEEVSKCEVVCANCHRERTQRGVESNLDPNNFDMAWEHRSIGPMSTVPVPNDVKVVQPFHDLVGTMSDHKLARKISTSFQTIFRYRKRMGIPAYNNRPITR